MSGIKILFLEDDTLYQESIKELLEDEEYIVETCTNGQEFLNKIFDEVYDLYIIDINVSLINGLEVMRVLKEYDDSAMKLVLTSYPNSLIKSFKYGCDDFLNKNSDIDELLLRIKSLIKRAYNSHKEFIRIANDLDYDLFHKILYHGKKMIDLEDRSMLVLDYLVKKRGKYVSSSELEKNTYPSNSESKSNVIRYHIWNLRNVLGKDLIESRKNFGYRLKPLQL